MLSDGFGPHDSISAMRFESRGHMRLNIREVEKIRQQLYASFMQKRILSQEEAFTTTLTKTNLKLFKSHLVSRVASLTVLTSKTSIARRHIILMAANSGRTIPDSVFAHESSIHPPSLTTKEKMYHGDKSGILDFSFQKNFQAKGPRQLQQCLMELCSSR